MPFFFFWHYLSQVEPSHEATSVPSEILTESLYLKSLHGTITPRRKSPNIHIFLFVFSY